MKSILYPLIASALITITPFLLSFEQGQDIVRGLFGYEYFAALLFIVFFRSKLKECQTNANLRKFYKIILITLIISLFFIAGIDVQNLMAIKKQNLGWYGLLPFATCSIAVVMVWGTKPFRLHSIFFILFIALIFHLEFYNQYAAQPLAQFPTIDYLERIAPKPAQRKNISKEFLNKFIVTDSVTITRDFVDTSRSNVIILIESWGIPLDIKLFESQINVFDGVVKAVGIHNRMYSRTRTAEREDLIYKIHRDSTGRDTIFLPKIFSNHGYKTTFLFGGDSLEHNRYKYIANIGFNNAIYGTSLENNKTQNDSQMISKIDSILSDTTQKHFIAWTTSDTKFPLPKISDTYNSNVDSISFFYNNTLRHDLVMIANLVRQHPKVRFVVQGDHNPILSPIEFQNKFYKRWVPFIILN